MSTLGPVIGESSKQDVLTHQNLNANESHQSKQSKCALSIPFDQKSSKYFSLITKKLNEKCASLTKNVEISNKLFHQFETINELLAASKTRSERKKSSTCSSPDDSACASGTNPITHEQKSIAQIMELKRERRKRKRLARVKRRIIQQQSDKSRPNKLDRSVSAGAAVMTSEPVSLNLPKPQSGPSSLHPTVGDGDLSDILVIDDRDEDSSNELKKKPKSWHPWDSEESTNQEKKLKTHAKMTSRQQSCDPAMTMLTKTSCSNLKSINEYRLNEVTKRDLSQRVKDQNVKDLLNSDTTFNLVSKVLRK